MGKMTDQPSQHADICLLLEGTYPFVTGGVSNWAHELIQEQNHLTFHLVAIVPFDAQPELKYQLPSNVVSLKTVRLAVLPQGDVGNAGFARRLHNELKGPLASITSEKPLDINELRTIVNAFRSCKLALGHHILLDREEAWDQLLELYENAFEEQSFLDYFWSYRAIVGGIYSILLTELPSADVYHAMSTGYAGLMAARAKLETGKSAFVTEHGIYTNERRIEVVSAEWLEATASKALTIDKPRRDLRDLWIDSINNFSYVCYQACDEIITLFKGNQIHQLEDGADANKMRIIPNGIDIERFGKVKRARNDSPTIALIGRVVPIKDVKTYIRSVALLKQYAPDIKAYVLGPTDEDPAYYRECQTMVTMLGLKDNIIFTGRVQVDEYLEHIDVLVLTSLSEAQPLVMLEAGACGIPLVATDVGACREIIEGTDDEKPALGAGGFITALANPASTAEAIYKLLTENELYDACSNNIRKRIIEHYNQTAHHTTYRNLYAEHLAR